MSLFHLIVVALVQGVTEFLPISSSAHLVLVPELIGVVDQGLLIDVAVHVGTLLAVMTYFRRDVAEMACGFLKLCRGEKTPGGRLALLLILATIPIVIVGGILHAVLPGGIRNLQVIAWATILFGILLWWADKRDTTVAGLEALTPRQAVLIGMAQILALIPGTSRSGITMTAARTLGFSRTEAAHFSLLLSIPTILAAGMLSALDVGRAGSWALTFDVLVSAGLAYLAGLAAIAAMMRWLQSAGFAPFVAYRVILGALLLIWIHS